MKAPNGSSARTFDGLGDAYAVDELVLEAAYS